MIYNVLLKIEAAIGCCAILLGISYNSFPAIGFGLTLLCCTFIDAITHKGE